MTYCISDIHGEYELFLALMEKVNFQKSDTLIVLGDMIDKGRDSVKVMRALLPYSNCKVILGNHELAFLHYYNGLMREKEKDFEGVLKKAQEYFPYDGALLTWELIDLLEELPAYYEAEEFICVHAGAPLSANGQVAPMQSAMVEQLVYDRNFKEPGILPKNSKCVLYGHTPTRYLTNEDRFIFYPREKELTGRITDYCKIHLDTGVSMSGVLGCLRVEDVKEFYVTDRKRRFDGT